MLVKTHQSMAGICDFILCCCASTFGTRVAVHYGPYPLYPKNFLMLITSLCWLNGTVLRIWKAETCRQWHSLGIYSGYILGDLSKCRGSGSRDRREKSGKSLVPWIVLIAHVGLQVEFRYAGLGWVSRDSEITPTVEVLIAPSADTFSVGIYPLNGGIMIFRTSK